MNTGDVVMLAQVFNSSSPTPPYTTRRDLNQDGFINTGDVVILAQFFNSVCS